jgi:hypothetical protein
MIVTVFGLSGLRNAYRSVLSASGSLAIIGASLWLDESSMAVKAISPVNNNPLIIFRFI